MQFIKTVVLTFVVDDDPDAKRSVSKSLTSFASKYGAEVEDSGWSKVSKGSRVKEAVTPIAESKPKSKSKDESAGHRGFATAGGVRKHVMKGSKGYGHDVVFGAEGTQGMDYDEARAKKRGGYCKDCPEQ
jgi:hypothetical protein